MSSKGNDDEKMPVLPEAEDNTDKKTSATNNIMPLINGVLDSIDDKDDKSGDLYNVINDWYNNMQNPIANQALHPDEGDALLSPEDILAVAVNKFGTHPDEIVKPKVSEQNLPRVVSTVCHNAKMTLMSAIRSSDKKVFVKEYYVDDPNTLLSTTEVTEDMVRPEVVLPSINGDDSVNQGRHPSSSLAYMLAQASKNSLLVSDECIKKGKDAYHVHSAPLKLEKDGGGNYTGTPRPIMPTAITPAFEPNKPRPWWDFTQWYTNPVLRAQRWAQGGSGLWAAGQNFLQIPLMPLLLTQCYIASHCKLERLSRWFVYAQHLGWPRWINRFHNIFLYRYGDTVAGYIGWFNRLFMAYALVPGMLLHPVYAILNPHYYDKTLSYPDPAVAAAAVIQPSLRWMDHYTNSTLNLVVRFAQLFNQIVRDKIFFRFGNPPSKPLGQNEESEYLYLNTCMFQCLFGHVSKIDRLYYHWPIAGRGHCPEWMNDASFMVMRNEDITANHWDSFDEVLLGLSQIIKTKYPQPPFATFHVIYGETEETILSGMEFILYWNFYRPLVRPLLYRIEIRDGESNGSEQPKKKMKGMPKEELNN